MTVSTTTNSVVYRGNGAATSFAVPFLILDEDHLVVKRRVFATGAIDATYVGTDYTYVGIGDPSGTLTLDGAALSSTYELVIQRVVPYDQQLDIVNAGGFYPDTVEEQLDLIVMQVQQVAEVAGRAFRVPAGTELEDTILIGNEGKFLSIDADGLPVWVEGSGVDADLRTDLAGSGGSALSGFLPSGAGAVAVSVQTKLRQTVNAADFGFSTAGTGAANAAALAAAVTAVAGGGVIKISAGTFTLDTTSITADVVVEGAGMEATILVQGTHGGASQGVLYANSGSDVAFLDNITVRDLTIKCTTGTFDEHIHLLALHGVRHALVERVKLYGAQGDGIMIGAGTGGAETFHNFDVTIRNCVIDGVNRENRNGISVIDCDGLVVEGCEISNHAKSTMPGAIDIEPNGNAAHVVRGIKIRNNVFRGNGGNIGVVALEVNATVTLPPVDVQITGNSFYDNLNSNEIAINTSRVTTATSVDSAVLISGNYGYNGADKPLSVVGVRGVTITNNRFEDYPTYALLGFDGATDLVRDVVFNNNRLTLVGTDANLPGLLISTSNGVKVIDNDFDRCGPATNGGVAIRLHDGVTSDNLTIRDNRVVPAANQVAAIAVGTHTQTPANNRQGNNQFGGLTNGLRSQDEQGLATLVAGVVVVTMPGVAATTRILVSRNTDGGTPGCSYSVTRTAGTSFTITSKQADGTTTEVLDTSVMAYQLIPAA